jgi:hypothetical protein
MLGSFTNFFALSNSGYNWTRVTDTYVKIHTCFWAHLERKSRILRAAKNISNKCCTEWHNTHFFYLYISFCKLCAFEIIKREGSNAPELFPLCVQFVSFVCKTEYLPRLGSFKAPIEYKALSTLEEKHDEIERRNQQVCLQGPEVSCSSCLRPTYLMVGHPIYMPWVLSIYNKLSL